MKKFTILAAAVLTTLSLTAQNRKISIDDVVSGRFYAENPTAITPMADGEHYLQAQDNCILKYSFKTGAVTDTVLNLRTARGERLTSLEGFILSPTEDIILLEQNVRRMFRNSYSAQYYIFTIRNNRIDPLTQGRIQVPSFSPDGHNIAFVRDNNIFLVKLLFNNAEVQVTKDGESGKVRNGIPDWVYDEEFGVTRAYEFSADSRMLAWIRFDESNVAGYDLPYFNTSINRDAYSQEQLSYVNQKYPTAGGACSKVSVHSFDIKSSVIRDMDLKLDSTSYIPRIQFAQNEDNSLFIFTLNRLQNRLDIYSANPRSTLCTLTLRQEDERYIDEAEYMETRFYGNRFIMQSERDGHNHLYLYGLNGKLERQITKGDFDVLALHGYDAKSGTVYYESNESGMYDCAVWKIDSKGKRTNLTPQQGTNHAVFSTGCKYFINSWSDMNTPYVVTRRDAQGKQLSVIENNTDTRQDIAEYGFHKKETFSFQTTDGTTLYGWIIKPSGADESHPCPLIMFQYNGPGSNKVLNQWNTGFYPGASLETFLMYQGYAVAVVDGRGTGCRGADFKKQTYKHLGVMEAHDQVAAANYLGSLPYIDADRIGIWGWSYGGYTTLMSMSEGTPVFKCGVAVAPVTDWRLYDAIYTERFMQQPKQNADGYHDASAIDRINRLSGKLLIIHGLDDDNVFFSNTAAYIDALINAGKDFEMQVYPGKEHSITGFATRKHLFTRMLRFFNENLKTEN